MPTATRNIRQMADGRFRVRYRLGTKERKKLFDTEADAKKFLKDEREKILKKGRGALELTGTQQARIMILIDTLADGEGIARGLQRLEAAAKYYRKHAKKDCPRTVKEAVADLVADWKASKRDARYISNAGALLRGFADDFPKPISAVTPREIHDWLYRQPTKDLKTPKARISKLFAHAVLNGWIEQNFVSALRIERRKREPVQIPTYAEIKAVLGAAVANHRYHPLLPDYSQRLYEGTRASESGDTRVRAQNGYLIVPSGAAAKGGPARQKPLSDAYMAWARWCEDNGIARLSSREFAKLNRQFRAELGMTGIKKWHNWQRHSYASYKLPLLGDDLDDLAKQMGNSPQVLLNNYLGTVADEDVPLYWALRPEQLI